MNQEGLRGYPRFSFVFPKWLMEARNESYS